MSGPSNCKKPNPMIFCLPSLTQFTQRHKNETKLTHLHNPPQSHWIGVIGDASNVLLKLSKITCAMKNVCQYYQISYILTTQGQNYAY